MQPSEIENMPYYEYEYLIEDLETIIKEKNDAESGKGGKEHDVESLMKGASKYMPKQNGLKFPKMPKF